jgi:hypothetical protein
MDVPLYGTHDFCLSGKAVGNPFDVALTGRLVGPNGETLRIPGFYDGDNSWMIRFSPTALGRWKVRTESEDSCLNGRTIDGIECVPNPNPLMHGPLGVDPDHPHHFRHRDGSRSFPLGDEADWLFALDLDQATRYLDRLGTHGFNQVLMQVYAHSCNWSEGQPERLVPPPHYPWEGSNDAPDHSRLNPAFWRHLDGIIGLMSERGILAHLMIQVHNKNVSWPEPGTPNDDRFWRHLVSRYQAHGNVIWSLSKEQWKRADPIYWSGRVALIRELDAYDHLVTTHDVPMDEADFFADQQHRDYHAHILRERAKRAWPVMNVEYGYEPGPIPTYPRITLPDEMRCRMWDIILAGGYPVFYYANTAWDVVSLEEQPRGYNDFRVAREVMERIPYWEMVPEDHRVDKGYCLAKPGHAYLIYLPEGGRVHAELGELEKRGTNTRAVWINPRTGERIQSGPAKPGVRSYTTPRSFGFGDSLLSIEPLA